METGDAYQAVGGGLDIVELPFYYLGLNTVPKRFLAGAVGTGALLFTIKPSSLFYGDGTARPWMLSSSEEGAVVVPWWVISLGIGTIMATFI
jgi:hypothetical protein